MKNSTYPGTLRSVSPEVLRHIRKLVLVLLLKGATLIFIADIFNVGRSTLYSWLAINKKRGPGALLEVAKPGRKPGWSETIE
jgi:transposase